MRNQVKGSGPAPGALARIGAESGWSEAVRAICDLLCLPAGRRMRSAYVSIDLDDVSREAPAIGSLCNRLAAEHGLKAAVVLEDHAVTVRLTRLTGNGLRFA